MFCEHQVRWPKRGGCGLLPRCLWCGAQALCQERTVLPKRAKAAGETAASLGLGTLAADPASAEGHERSPARRTFAAFSRAHQLLPAFSRH